MSDMTSVVLAGGRSTRLGKDKAWVELAGRPLIEHVLSRLFALGNEIIMVTSQADTFPDLGVTKVADIYPDKGPLGGLYTGLKATRTCHCLVVACDMPLLNIALLQRLMELSPGYDVVVPRVGTNVEPLHAVYSRDCLEAIRAAIQHNRLQVQSFFDQVEVRYVDDAELAQFDPEHLSFFNINSESDLKKAQALLER
ncbi:MAG: molybdenum cofactor guanylyltransferase [Chloroflexota bacterium]